MNGLFSIYMRELKGYFQTPIAYIFIAIFVALNGLFTFYLGRFFERGEANLDVFFQWHPWLYLILIPTITMRIWAEERKSGTIELLMTMPIPIWQMVVGKFLAAWKFTSIALLCTFPIWWSVNYLGNPDNGVIFSSYIGSLLMAGGYISIGVAISATTNNQVIAFVITLIVGIFFTVTGFPMVMNAIQSILPQLLIETLSQFSFLINFQNISQGFMELRSILYFISIIVFWLFINILILENREN